MKLIFSILSLMFIFSSLSVADESASVKPPPTPLEVSKMFVGRRITKEDLKKLFGEPRNNSCYPVNNQPYAPVIECTFKSSSKTPEDNTEILTSYIYNPYNLAVFGKAHRANRIMCGPGYRESKSDDIDLSFMTQNYIRDSSRSEKYLDPSYCVDLTDGIISITGSYDGNVVIELSPQKVSLLRKVISGRFMVLMGGNTVIDSIWELKDNVIKVRIPSCVGEYRDYTAEEFTAYIKRVWKTGFGNEYSTVKMMQELIDENKTYTALKRMLGEPESMKDGHAVFNIGAGILECRFNKEGKLLNWLYNPSTIALFQPHNNSDELLKVFDEAADNAELPGMLINYPYNKKGDSRVVLNPERSFSLFTYTGMFQRCEGGVELIIGDKYFKSIGRVLYKFPVERTFYLMNKNKVVAKSAPVDMPVKRNSIFFPVPEESGMTVDEWYRYLRAYFIYDDRFFWESGLDN